MLTLYPCVQERRDSGDLRPDGRLQRPLLYRHHEGGGGSYNDIIHTYEI